MSNLRLTSNGLEDIEVSFNKAQHMLVLRDDTDIGEHYDNTLHLTKDQLIQLVLYADGAMPGLLREMVIKQQIEKEPF